MAEGNLEFTVTVLVEEGGEETEKSFVLEDSEKIIRIGRAPANDIVLTHRGVSSFHAELRKLPGLQLLSVRDTSMNGTGLQPADEAEARLTALQRGRDEAVPHEAFLLVPFRQKAGAAPAPRHRLRVSYQDADAAAEALERRRQDAEAKEKEPEPVPEPVQEPEPVEEAKSEVAAPEEPSEPTVNITGTWLMTADKDRSFEYTWRQDEDGQTFAGEQVGGSQVTGTISGTTIEWTTGAVVCRGELAEGGRRIEDGKFWKKKSGRIVGTFTGTLQTPVQVTESPERKKSRRRRRREGSGSKDEKPRKRRRDRSGSEAKGNRSRERRRKR